MGCAGDTNPSDLSGGVGGKADGDGESCEAYVLWLATEARPAIDEGTATEESIRIGAAAHPCGTGAAYDAWLLQYTDVLIQPFWRQQGQAFEDFVLISSALRGDYDAYLTTLGADAEVVASAALLRFAKPSLMNAAPADAAFSYQEWTSSYGAMLDQLAAHLNQPSVAESESYREAPMYISEPEGEWLELLIAGAPRSNVDGAYAAWFELYRWYLDRAFGRISGFSHQGSVARGLADQERSFLSEMASLRPRGQGDQDGSAFMAHYAASVAAMPASAHERQSFLGATENLVLLEAVAPEALRGPKAFAFWLETYVDVIDTVDAPRFLAHKPCADPGAARVALEEHREIGLVMDVDALLAAGGDAGMPESCDEAAAAE